MKITIGGSYHEPGWTEVCNLAKKLRDAGHEVLAPGDEWEPIDNSKSFVRFKGEENNTVQELQDSFFEKMRISDAHVICNFDSYLGMASSVEFGYAAMALLNKSCNLKHMYLMNPPFFYSLFSNGNRITIETFKDLLFNSSEYRNALGFYKKFLGAPDGVFGYESVEDFYEDLRVFSVQVEFLQMKGLLTIGLDQLLDINKDKTSDKSKDTTSDLDER